MSPLPNGAWYNRVELNKSGKEEGSQRVEIFSRSATGWLYQQYGAGQGFWLSSLDIRIEVQQLYRRLSIPARIEQAVEEDEAQL